MCDSWNLGLFCNILHHILHVTKYQSMIMAVRELWPVASRTNPACRVECSRTRWGSVGCWGMALTSTCTSLEWAACFVPLKKQQMILVFFVFFNSKMLTGKCVKVLLTGGQAERKLGLKVTSLTVKVLVRYHHHHSFTPAGKRCQRQILIRGVETHLEHKQVLIFNCKWSVRDFCNSSFSISC